MIGEIVDFNNLDATKVMATIVFVAVPIASLFRAKSFRSLAISINRFFIHSIHSKQNVADANTTTMEEEKEDDGVELDCAVCLCQVSARDKYWKLPCSHGFHVDCISAWLRARSSCPLCRSPVTVPFPLPNNNQLHQEHHLYDGLVSWFYSPLEKLCLWMESPLNSELMSHLSENSYYLIY